MYLVASFTGGVGVSKKGAEGCLLPNCCISKFLLDTLSCDVD